MGQPQRKILLIEDEIPMLQALTDTFKNAGFDTFTAQDGEEGLTKAFYVHPDIIVLDILMPKLDGMEVLRRLRADDWGNKIPIVLLTNVSPEGSKILQGIVAYQPAYYLVKSDVTLQDILDKINDILK